MQLLTDFLNYLAIEKNYSPETVRTYKTNVTLIANFINEKYGINSIHSINELKALTHSMLRSYLVAQSLQKSTIQTRIYSLRSFLKYHLKKGNLDTNPASRLQIPKKQKRLPVFIRQEDISILLDKTTWEPDFEGVRDKAIIELLYSAGLRRAEIGGLKYTDINWNNRTVKILGKGNKERIVPFGIPAYKAMQTYITHCEANTISFQPIFFSDKKGTPLTLNKIYLIVKQRLGSIPSLTKRSPHILRHTFATHLVDSGADLNAVKELLGHKSLASTQVYVHNTISKLKNIHNQAHPRS